MHKTNNKIDINIFGLIYAIAIFIAGIYLRLWYINNVATTQIFDFQTYQELATNIFLRVGHTLDGEPAAFQGMAYPIVLGYVYRFMGNAKEMTAKNFNVILSALTMIAIYFTLIKLTKRNFVIYTAFTIVALLPNYIAYNNVIGTEVFITFILSVIILLQVYEFDDRIRVPLLGIFIGGAALTKPFFLAYPVVVAVVHWLKGKDLRKTAILFGSVFLIMALTVAPWTYRNYQKFGRFIPVSYNSGYVFYLNNNAYNTNGAWMPIHEAYASPELQKKIDEILQNGQRSEKLAHELEVVFKPEARKWIRENPKEFLKLGIIRLKGTFFSGSWDIDIWTRNDTRPLEAKQKTWTKEQRMEHERHFNFTKGLRDTLIHLLSGFGFLYVLVSIKPILIGLFNGSIKLPHELTIPVLNSAFFIAIYFVFEGQARYNFPVLFLFAISTALCFDILRKGIENNPYSAK